jgi:hypothetical protein
MFTQEEAREKKEAAKKKQLEALKGTGNLTQQAVAAQVQTAKDIEKRQKLVVKNLHKGATDTSKRKPDKPTAQTPGNKSKKQKETVLKEKLKERPAKKKRLNKAAQGERKVPVATDKHGCEHSGLLELLALERKYLQTFVKMGGWLYQTPCHDCAKNEDGGDERVLEVSSLLTLKGKQELGVYCNCGPVGHKMVQEDEPVRKQQWACNMVLCMDCFNRRKTEMGDTGGKRTRREKTGAPR